MTAAARTVRPFIPRPSGHEQQQKGEKVMGLDMYACILEKAPPSQVDFKGEDAAKLHYWRKHPNLHGWMEQLYRDKGGAEEIFNCVNVQLSAGDLDDLELAIKSNALPETAGFFFGVSDGSEINDDLVFIAKARQALAYSKTVFYSSWW
jgi:hypothetical protein